MAHPTPRSSSSSSTMPKAAASAPAATSSCSRAAATTDAEDAKHFFFAEYRLNHLLFTYPKPTIAIMDGITMGGGVGISLPCDYPDRDREHAARHARNGHRPVPRRRRRLVSVAPARPRRPVHGADRCSARRRRMPLPSASPPITSSRPALEDLVERHRSSRPTRVAGRGRGGARSRRPRRRSNRTCRQITKLFASDRLEEMLAALEADESDWAQSGARDAQNRRARCRARSRLRLLAEGATRASFADEMRAEYALASRVVRTHDFREGVRALLIDKDNEPHWDPATPEEVSATRCSTCCSRRCPKAKPGRRSRRPKNERIRHASWSSGAAR